MKFKIEIKEISFTILALFLPVVFFSIFAKEPKQDLNPEHEKETIISCLASPLHIRFLGKGFYPVELDGYGVVKKSHWPVAPEIPFTSPALPQYYIDNGSPVAYLGGSRPIIEVKGQLKESFSGKVTLYGVSKNLLFKGKAVVKNGVFSGVVKSNSRLPKYITSWEHENIKWTLRMDDKNIDLGETKNSIYVLLDKPLMSLLHTPLKIASIAGEGLQDTDKITRRIWNRFQNQKVKRARDKKPLLYYGLYKDSAPAALRSMLIAGSGQCVAWAYLLYSALATQGIESEVTIVTPQGKGRIFVKNWRIIEGNQFIHTGKNGINETKLVGDDISVIPKGKGRPFSRIWISESLKIDSLVFDDEGKYETGPNGIVDTRVPSEEAIPIIPYKFALPNQRVYVVKPWFFSKKVRLGGDDVLVEQISSTYVLSGPNGIVETPRQDRFLVGKDGKPHPYISWHPKVGVGATHINFTFATPKVPPLPKVQGDDIRKTWWINSGENGISDTPGANFSTGKEFSTAIKPGPNGVFDSQPGGDDEIIDLRKLMKAAPKGYEYIHTFNMYPEPGVTGQNNDSPPPDYPNHMILRVGEQYYDPSYGTGPFRSQHQWEKESIVGVGQQVRDENNDFIKFNEKIMFYVKPVKKKGPITSFGKALAPN